MTNHVPSILPKANWNQLLYVPINGVCIYFLGNWMEFLPWLHQQSRGLSYHFGKVRSKIGTRPQKASVAVTDLSDREQHVYQDSINSLILNFFQFFLDSLIRAENLSILDIPGHIHELRSSALFGGKSPEV